MPFVLSGRVLPTVYYAGVGRGQRAQSNAEQVSCMRNILEALSL